MSSSPLNTPSPLPSGNSSKIFSPIILPCGRTAPNRLVKVALYEHLADLFGGPPNLNHFSLYARWAQHGWGMIITGNVQVSPTHLSLGRDLVLPRSVSDGALQPFRKLAQEMHRYEGSSSEGLPLAIMQLSHGGRQSPNFLGGRPLCDAPLAPSAIALGTGSDVLSSLVEGALFQRPQAMSLSDIDDVVTSFVRGARLAALAGFDGIQLHAAHGYLLAQFISPKTNHRTDEYSCTSLNGLKLVHRIVVSIREIVPPDFIVGIKLNASDYVDGAAKSSKLPESPQSTPGEKEDQEARALSHIRTLASWHSIDFIEVSGGDYENPEFMSQSALSKSPRQAFFAHFSSRALEILEEDASSDRPKPLILLTGGLRTPSHLQSALASHHADLLGIGRGSITSPDLPDVLRQWEQAQGDNVDNTFTPFAPEVDLFQSYPAFVNWVLSFASAIKLVGAGSGMAWHVVMLRHIAETPLDSAVRMDYNLAAVGSIIHMWVKTEWMSPRKAGIYLLLAAICGAIWMKQM
ncbi:FMN-linked oxidoreductase [Athelia psychrophila]|uniref:FMN-linked oxidoreductase n=1 Tax=Athelia psychrophila TaxID=1759441 RepID=A0A166NGI5_9AGAM|nr:FMN-linked oxidoreductase [Fibularhizoctonia sp. CBS 109695]